MQLWEFVFEADRRLDLADPAAALEWLCSRPWPMPSDHSWWTIQAQRNWTDNIHALRSLGVRLKRKRRRRPSPGALPEPEGAALVWDYMADAVLRRYIGMLYPAVNCRPENQPLAYKTFRGLVLVPTIRTGDGDRSPNRPHPGLWYRDDLDYWWQVVFHSLVADGGPVVCQGCGRELKAVTSTGRPSRQRTCKHCRWQNWRRKQPLTGETGMQARWKRQKQKQRERERQQEQKHLAEFRDRGLR
jgi:hypothetical protein